MYIIGNQEVWKVGIMANRVNRGRNQFNCANPGRKLRRWEEREVRKVGGAFRIAEWNDGVVE